MACAGLRSGGHANSRGDDRPQLGQQQRHRDDPDGHVDALVDRVEPGRRRRPAEARAAAGRPAGAERCVRGRAGRRRSRGSRWPPRRARAAAAAQPSVVVSHGPRSGLRQKLSPRRPGRRPHGACSSANQRPPSRQRARTRRPAARRRPGHRVGAHPRPREPLARARAVLQPHPLAPRRRPPGGSSSTSTGPPGASSPARRRSSASGDPPMPMLPSSSSALFQLPVPGRRSKIDASRTRGACAARQRDRRRRDVDADAEHPPARERVDVAPRAAADVQHGPAGAIEHALVHRSGPAEPHVDAAARGRGRGRRAATGSPAAVEDRAEEVGGASCDPRSARGRGRSGRPVRSGCDGARVRDAIDVAQRGQQRHAQPEPRAAARAARGPSTRCSSGRPGRRAAAASRRPMAQ